jgi:hypothetical protein
MKPEYKEKTKEFVSSVETRLQAIDGMLNGTRQVDEALAKKYIKEALHGLERVVGIVDIS